MYEADISQASVMALFWAPTDAVQGNVYRILYIHVPLAWLAYLAFVIVFLASPRAGYVSGAAVMVDGGTTSVDRTVF